MHCAILDHIPPFFFPALATTATHLKHFEAEWKRASLCNQFIVIRLQIQKVKTEMSHWEDSSFSKTGLRKLALQVNLFLLCWKDNTMKAGQRRRRRLGQQMCVSPLRSVWERERPFQAIPELSSVLTVHGKTAPFNHWPTNLFPTIHCVYPQPNWWLVGLLFKWPADLICSPPPQQMQRVLFPPLSRMAICGGTHGNEMSGVYMLRELKKQSVGPAGTALITVLSNPRAVESCRRYIDKDLNRCFTSHLLRQVGKKKTNYENIPKRRMPLPHRWHKCTESPGFPSDPVTDETPYEQKRAHELNAQLGPKGSREAVDLLCDLHNTTSNMGLCLIFYSSDWIPLHILKYLQVIFGPGGALGYRGVCWMKTSWRSWSVCGARARLEPSRFLRSNHQQMSKTSELLLPFLQLLLSTRCNRVCAAATVAKKSTPALKKK